MNIRTHTFCCSSVSQSIYIYIIVGVVLCADLILICALLPSNECLAANAFSVVVVVVILYISNYLTLSGVWLVRWLIRDSKLQISYTTQSKQFIAM